MLNSGISNIKVFACNSNKTLANAIADKLGLKLGDCEVEMKPFVAQMYSSSSPHPIP